MILTKVYKEWADNLSNEGVGCFAVSFCGRICNSSTLYSPAKSVCRTNQRYPAYR